MCEVSKGKENINIQNNDSFENNTTIAETKDCNRICQKTINDKTISDPTPNKNEIKIIEWRFNQYLGEKLSEEEIRDEENQSYIITDIKTSDRGDIVVAGEKGGRIILFQKAQKSPKNKAFSKLQYFYEYSAYDKDFDVHKSTEYSEAVRCLSVLPTYSQDKIDILSCSYRTIKLNRVYNYKQKLFTNDDYFYERNSTGDKPITIPKLRSIKYDLKAKNKINITLYNSNELNSLSYNKQFTNQFLTSDDNKILLWDMNHINDPYCIVDLEESSTNSIEEYSEKVTKSLISDSNPNIISYGTNYGSIQLLDTRTSSDFLKYSTSFVDEFLNITNSGFNLTKTIFSSQVMAVHDLNFSLNDENLFASRHYLSVNIWDKRNNKSPVSRFLVYEPVISKLSYLYLNNYLLNDKFSLSADKTGRYIATGRYNNMFHVFDIEQRLNTQITVDSSNEKNMNTNIIRKINSKGSCYYKKDDPAWENINFKKKIGKICYSPVDNYLVFPTENCINTYNGNVITKKL